MLCPSVKCKRLTSPFLPHHRGLHISDVLLLQQFGHLMQRANSLETTLMLWKTKGKRRRRQQRMRCLDSITHSVQSLNRVQLFVTSWNAPCLASLSITNSQSLLKLMSIESVMPSNHLILCCPLLLQPSIFPSIRVFSNELVLRIRWPKHWSFSFSISPSNEYSGLISFRIDWLDLLAVQGTLKSLLYHHSSKHQFFSVQLSL